MPVVLPVSPPSKFRPEVLGRSGAAFGGLLAPTATRYVRKTGSDANGGTSPSDAWQTINKALTTAPSGAVVYVGGGTYREVVTVTITPTQKTALIGDVDGAFTGDVGPVIWTAYTAGDTAAPSATALLTLNGKSNLTFQNILFVGGNNVIVTATTLTSQNIQFFDSAFLTGHLGASGVMTATCGYRVPFNWQIDRCLFSAPVLASNAITLLTFTLTTGSGVGDYDAQVLITNSLALCGAGNFVGVAVSGAAAGQGGGVRMRNCTAFSAVRAVVVNANASTKIPCVVTGCYMTGNGPILQAATLGQIVEDYNLLQGTTPRTNVTAGGHSISDGSYAPLYHFGQEMFWFGNLRPFGEPMAGSPMISFGTPDTSILTDLRKALRPVLAGDQAVGAFERGNTFVKETGTVHTGSSAISIIGAGFQDFDIYVDAGAVTVTVFCEYDSSYSGPLPQLKVVNGTQVGVSDVSVVATPNSLNAFAQLSLTINPNAAGIVTVRLIAGDVSEVGKTIFDTFAVA